VHVAVLFSCSQSFSTMAECLCKHVYQLEEAICTSFILQIPVSKGVCRHKGHILDTCALRGCYLGSATLGVLLAECCFDKQLTKEKWAPVASLVEPLSVLLLFVHQSDK